MGRVIGYVPESAVEPTRSTKAELAEIAAGLGIEIPPNATKAELADLIAAAEGGE